MQARCHGFTAGAGNGGEGDQVSTSYSSPARSASEATYPLRGRHTEASGDPARGPAPARQGNLPLVSAIIPCYNYGRYVTQAVESALAQTYPNMEVIVVDDGSTDDTRRRLEPYFARIRYIYQENRGASAARNTGIRHARGEWIAPLDADDYWHPRKTESQLAAVPDLDAVGLIGSDVARDAFPESLPANPNVEPVGVRDFLLTIPMSNSGALIKRACLDHVGWYDDRIKSGSAEDRDLFLRIAARFRAAVVKSPCWYYRHHEQQASLAPWRMYRSYRMILEDFFRNHEAHRGLRKLALGYLYLDTAMCLHEAGERAQSLRFLLWSFLRWPWPMSDQRRAPYLRLKMLARLAMGEWLFMRFLAGRRGRPAARGEQTPAGSALSAKEVVAS